MSLPRLRLFGCPVLLDPDGAPLSFRTHKHLALLVYLALEARDREIPRDYLIDLLWPQAPHVRGRHSLAQALSVIRQLLGRQVLSRGGRAVQVLGNLVTDIDVMAAGGDPPSELGEPLEGLDHLGGVTFAHWLDITRERLRRTARECLAGQLETARSSGDGRRVHERAVQLYRVDPLSDTAVQALCERLLNDGDAVAAASLLRNHVERVESEAGLPTPPGLKRLLVLLECGHLATRRIDRSARRAWQHRPPEIFVGRERELSRLESQWSAVVEGNRRTCLVAGPTGIGKSSLLSRFSTSVVARSATVSEVACQEIGQNIPFAAVSDFIIALARYPGAGSVEGRWLAEASRVAPGVRSWWDGIPDPPPVPADAVRLRVAETLVRMIDAAREGEPMVLVLDDLGYLDPASRDILHLLSRRLHDSPLLIVASARTAEEASLMIGDPVGRAGMSWDEIISLEPLDADHVRQMVADLCGDRGPLDECTLRTIVELAQGNPYLVEMLLSDWRRQPEASLVIAHVRGDVTATRWRPPTTMLQAFERQHRGLSGEAERVLNLLAVAGRRLPADDIGRLLRLEEATADSAYMQLLDRAILRVEDGGLSFKNQVHRSFVYDAMAEGTRRFLHGKVGDMLAALGQRVSQDLLEAAHHFIQGCNPKRAVDTLILGSEQALSQGAPKEAARALQRIGAKTGGYRRAERELLLSEAYLRQGIHAQALSQVRVVCSDALALSFQARAATVTAEAMHRGQLAGGAIIADHARNALALAEQAADESLILRTLQLNAEVAHDAADRATIERVREMAHAIQVAAESPHILPAASTTQAYCLMITGHHRRAAEFFTRGIDGLRRQGREIELRRALNGLGICLTNTGNLPSAMGSFEEALVLAKQAGDPFAQSILWDNLAVIHEDTGQFSKAMAARRKAFGLSAESPNDKRLAELLTNAASLAITLGELGQASSYLAESIRIARGLGIPGLLITALVARSDLEIASENLPGAWGWAEEAISLAEQHRDDWLPIGDYNRTRLHFLWATQGYAAYASMRHVEQDIGLSFRLTQKLELEAFQEWVEQREGSLSCGSQVVPVMAKRKLYGSLVRLVSLGICPTGQISTNESMTSDRKVREAFPAAVVDLPPAPVDVLQRGA